jgi:hypothetical protein
LQTKTTEFIYNNNKTSERGCNIKFEKLRKSFTAYTFQQRGHEVAQFLEVLRYKQEGRGFDSR